MWPKEVSLSSVLVIVSTRRLRGSSGAMVSKTPASRSEACPSMASVVASSCATLKSSNPAAIPPRISADVAPPPAPVLSSSEEPSICRITRGSRVAVAAVRFCMTSVLRPGSITSTMLTRWRYAAMTAAACEVSIGDPSAAKLGPITSCASSPIAPTSPAISSRRRCTASSSTLRRSVTARTIARHRSSLRRAGCWTSRSSKTLVKSICSIAMARWPCSSHALAGPPRARTASMSSAINASSAWRVRTGTSPANVSCRMSCWWSHAAASVTGPSAPAGDPPMSSVSGVTPKANTCPAVVLASVVRRRSTDALTAG